MNCRVGGTNCPPILFIGHDLIGCFLIPILWLSKIPCSSPLLSFSTKKARSAQPPPRSCCPHYVSIHKCCLRHHVSHALYDPGPCWRSLSAPGHDGPEWLNSPKKWNTGACCSSEPCCDSSCLVEALAAGFRSSFDGASGSAFICPLEAGAGMAWLPYSNCSTDSRLVSAHPRNLWKKRNQKRSYEPSPQSFSLPHPP